MFYGCRKLKEIKGLNKFETRKVKEMFYNCNQIEYLDLSNFNTSNVTNMSYMISFCLNLKEVKGLDKFNKNNIINN